MSFDFFNVSNLAFGSKLTAAFRQLDRLYQEADENIRGILEQQEIFNQYLNRNYQAPVPTKPFNACRSNEVINLVTGQTIFKSMDYNNGKINIEIIKHFPLLNRICRIYGESELLKGYAFFKLASSNSKPETEIRFSESSTAKSGELLLFEYHVDIPNKMVTVKDTANRLDVYPLDFTQYSGLSWGDLVSNPYTAENYECVIIKGYQWADTTSLRVVKNGTAITDTFCWGTRDHITLYLKPGDTIEGVWEEAKKLNYLL